MADIIQERAYTTRAPWRMIAVALLVLALIVGALLVAGSQQRRLPAPFGPAANGLIAYSDQGDILLVDAATGATTTAITGPEQDGFPVYSRQGDRLMFLRAHAGGHDLFAAAADGQGQTKLAGPIGEISAIEWSPDASRIAVASLDHGRSVLDIVRTDGSGSTRLGTDLDITDLAWRPPTGESLVVRGSNGFTVGLYMLDKDGTGLTMLDTRSEGLGNNDYWAPAWSPDGKRLAFNLSSSASQPDTYELRTNVVDVSPTGLVTSQKELRFDEGNSDEGWPIWSPTGDRLLINASVRDSEVFRVAVGSSDGFGRLILTGPPTTSHEAMEHRWSPDGRQIMARYWEEKAAWLLDPAGGPGTEVPYWATSDDAPSWQRTLP